MVVYVTLRIIRHRILRAIWHNSPSKVRATARVARAIGVVAVGQDCSSSREQPGSDDPSLYGAPEFPPPASLGPESTYEGPPVDLMVTLKLTPV